jgi:DNA-binding MarR family transcriptional regulator
MVGRLSEVDAIDAPKTVAAVPLARSLGYHVRQLSESWTEAMHRRTEKKGITEGQWPYLRELWEEDGLSQRELSERVGRRGPSTFAALKLLERSGCVEVVPNPDDRRKTRVFLTARGRALQKEFVPAIREVERMVTAGMTAEEIAAFKRAIVVIQRNLDESNRSRSSWGGWRTRQLAAEVGL